MIRALGGLSALLLASASLAQQAPIVTAEAPGAVLRGLDRLSGELTEYEVPVGGAVRHGNLMIQLDACRYPADNPSGDAFGYLVIRDTRVPDPVFQGWMIASSPALNALDHMRYDVWVMRCKTS